MNQTLSICFVSQEYPEETGWGGIGTYTYEMAHGLAKRGHNIHVIARGISGAKTYEEKDGVRVHRIMPPAATGRFFWRLNKIWEGYRFEVSKAVENLMKEAKLDILESPDVGAELLAYQLLHQKKVPVVIRLHSASKIAGFTGNKKRLSQKLDVLAEKETIRLASALTAPSQAAISGRDPKYGLPSKMTATIYNPVNTAHFYPRERMKKTEGPQILYLGRMEPVKGADVLVRAIPEICRVFPETRFTFAGVGMGKSDDDPPEKLLAEWLPKQFVDRVTFMKRIPHEKLPEIFSQADICVVPSRWEQFGYSCAEAMASGKPVIASRVGGLKEIVEDEVSGLLFPVDDSKVLAQAVIRLLKNPALAASLGRAARQRIVEKFSCEVMLPQFEEFYKKTVHSK